VTLSTSKKHGILDGSSLANMNQFTNFVHKIAEEAFYVQ